MIPPPSHRRTAVLYVGGIAAAALVFAAVSWIGERAFSASRAATPAPPHHVDAMLHVLLALAVVIVTARLVGSAFRVIHQPPVIGEVLGGIMLGPSLLGALSPAAYAFILPPATAPFLGVIAQLGVILYMFVVGLHLDLRVVRTSGRTTLAISHASIVVPFVLGALLSLALYRTLAGEGAGFTAFALFLGVSMSVTAFPVLARILDDRRLDKTELGMLALTCAAVDDVTAWCMLAFVVGLSQATMGAAFATAGLTIAYIAVMFLVVQPVVRREVARMDAHVPLTQAALARVFVALLLSALATEVIGIHAIFGAFLLGAVVPPASRVAADVTGRLDDVVRVMFLPAFFALTGMRTEIGLLNTWQDWMICAAIIGVATLGKFGGTFAAARYLGLARRESAALGILMNTRGMVELIVLNIGLDIGAISPRLFTMLVLVALATTFMTTPALDWVRRPSTSEPR